MKLLDNGLDSLSKCINNLKHAATMDISDSKYEFTIKEIIISLHHSIETLFKYLIYQKDPFLIFDDLKKYFKNELEKQWNNNIRNTSLNTIQFLDAVNCVLSIYNIKIEKTVYTKIEKLNQDRNALTHYTYSFNDREPENYIALLLPDLFAFITNLFLNSMPMLKLVRFLQILKICKKNPQKLICLKL